MRTVAIAISFLAVAGCENDGPVIYCPDDLEDFRILEPTTTRELIPDGEPVRVTWLPRPGEEGRVELVSPEGVHGLWPVDLGTGMVDMATGTGRGESPWPGVYQLRISWLCSSPSPVVNADPTIVIGVQGIRFVLDNSATAIDRGAGSYELIARTASLSSIDLELVFDPSTNDPPGADAYVMYRTTLPGELVATERRALPFTEQDVNGVDVPAGGYRVYGRITTGAGQTYVQGGPRISWF